MLKQAPAPLVGRERRRHVRYLLETLIWLEAVPGGTLHKLRSIDISAGGMRFGTNLSVHPDTRLRLYISLPYFLDLLVAVCNVRHVREQGNGCRYQIGVEFEDTDGIQTEQMEQFLTALHAAGEMSSSGDMA